MHRGVPKQRLGVQLEDRPDAFFSGQVVVRKGRYAVLVHNVRLTETKWGKDYAADNWDARLQSTVLFDRCMEEYSLDMYLFAVRCRVPVGNLWVHCICTGALTCSM